MDTALFLSSFLFFAISMCFTPGPNNTMVMAIGLAKGFRAALPFCIGAGIGANATLLLLGFGLGEVFSRFPAVYGALRYAGAAYMLWLAWKISGIGTGRGQKAGHAAKENSEDHSAVPPRFVQAFFFQLVNVKVWLTNIIIVSNYVGAGSGMHFRLFLCAAVLTVMGTGSMCLWAAGGSVMRRFLTSAGVRRANYVFAAFLALSVVLLFA